MKKYVASLAAALIALLSLAVLAPSAQAYPNPILTLKLSLSSVVSGNTFVATATASIKCDSLTIAWNGQRATGAGSTVTTDFKAPLVQVPTVITAHATCTYTATTGTAGAAIAATPQTLTAFANVTVLPLPSSAAGSSSGALPNTGGPSIGWLIGGIAALLAGIAAMYAGRRRTTGTASN